ncbi:MAG: hypothetical protein ABFE01_06500, partial [Phycisphaerales bacterium]
MLRILHTNARESLHFAEDRHFTRLPDGPRAGEPFVLGYGPRLLAAVSRTFAAPNWPATFADL